MRFRRIGLALDSVFADAGFLLTGLALLQQHVAEERLAFPYPLSMGVWSSHAFTATFRSDWERRAPLRLFRDWLHREAAQTREWLDRLVANAGR
jgi:hypothetical protein